MEKEQLIYPEKPKHKCETCIHYLQDRECAAFYDKIPSDIWNNKTEHDKVREGQLLPIIYKFGKSVL